MYLKIPNQKPIGKEKSRISEDILGLIALNYIMLPVYGGFDINTLEENQIGVKYL